jgi:amino acid permease
MAYIILDEKYRRPAKFVHHLVTMTIGLIVFIKTIMAFCQCQDLWPEFMRWGIGANVVMAIYLVVRFIRGTYRHAQ